MSTQSGNAITDTIKTLKYALEIVVCDLFGGKAKVVGNFRPERTKNLLLWRYVTTELKVCFAYTFEDGTSSGHSRTGIVLHRLISSIKLNLDGAQALRLNPLRQGTRRTRQ